MYRPLFIDYDYRITNSASGQIARVFWESKSEQDFQPTIICSSRESDFKSKWPIIEFKERYWIWYLGVVFRKFGVPDLSYIPDMEYFSWVKFVKPKLGRIIKETTFDYIHTLSSPQSTHLLGYELKKKTGKPWVAQFNDPWSDSSGRHYKKEWTRKRDLAYEKLVVENADLILHTNHILENIWEERYGAEVAKKMHVIPWSFNVMNLEKIDEVVMIHDKLRISHIGQIYSTRSAVTFIDALSILLDKHPEVANKIEVTFVGGVKNQEKEYAEKKNVDSFFTYVDTLPPEALSKYYLNSDIFLAIDVNLQRSPSFPSKVMMYHYYKRPIFGLTNPNSIMEEELHKSGHSVFYYGHPQDMADYLYKAVCNYEDLLTFDKDYWKRYTVENVTSKYLCLLEKILF